MGKYRILGDEKMSGQFSTRKPFLTKKQIKRAGAMVWETALLFVAGMTGATAGAFFLTFIEAVYNNIQVLDRPAFSFMLRFQELLPNCVVVGMTASVIYRIAKVIYNRLPEGE